MSTKLRLGRHTCGCYGLDKVARASLGYVHDPEPLAAILYPSRPTGAAIMRDRDYGGIVYRVSESRL